MTNSEFRKIQNKIIRGGQAELVALYFFRIMYMDAELDDGYFRRSKTKPHDKDSFEMKFYPYHHLTEPTLAALEKWGIIEEDLDGMIKIKSLFKNGEDKELTEKSESIIKFFNETCGTRYKKNAKATLSSIKGRLRDGYSVDDIKNVIKDRYNEWFDDDKMAQYIRPSTIFAPSKFEQYYNALRLTNSENTLRVRDIYGVIHTITKDRYDKAETGYFTII